MHLCCVCMEAGHVMYVQHYISQVNPSDAKLNDTYEDAVRICYM